jgi:hypothetical protein
LPAQFLVRDNGLFAPRGGPSLGLLVFVLGAGCLIAALVRPVGVLALPAGLGSVAIAIWYALRLRSFASGRFDDIFGVGTAVALIGGVVAIIGGILTVAKR